MAKDLFSEGKIPSVCPVAYKSFDGSVEVLDYLDLAKKEQVCGIEVCGYIFHLRNIETTLTSYLLHRGVGCSTNIPAIDGLYYLHVHRSAFEETVRMLNSYDIKADVIEDKVYLSKDTSDKRLGYIHAFNFKDGQFDFALPEDPVIIREASTI